MTPPPGAQLYAVYNSKFGQWRVCHNQWCEPGETSIVATLTSTGDDQFDEWWAREIVRRFNLEATSAQLFRTPTG